MLKKIIHTVSSSVSKMPHKVAWATNDDALFNAAKKTSGGTPDASAAAATGLRIFVGGLTWDKDEEFLREMLEDCGRITDVHVPLDPVSKHCKGFAFVTFSSAAEAAKAIREWDGKVVDDMKLKVNHAKGRDGETTSDGKPFGTIFNRTLDHAKADAARRREKAQQKKELKRMQPY